ncbi:unnamed protein product, partial [Choristocarpus tenellus]
GGADCKLRCRILTWNINGLRKVAGAHGGLKPLLDQFDSDVVCFQEIKTTRAALDPQLAQAEGYHCMFSFCRLPRKTNYSGVATFVRSASGIRTPAATTSLSDSSFFGTPADCGLDPARLAELEMEGRVLVTDHGHFLLFNIYGPCVTYTLIAMFHSSGDDEDERTKDRKLFKQDFQLLLRSRILQAEKTGQGVVLVGDLNACVSQLDHGFTMTDRDFYSSSWSRWIRNLLGLDNPNEPPRLVDCFRRLHPMRKGAFTCWNTQTGARENNYGTRIDYIITGVDLADKCLRSCNIMPEFEGSDHCPVHAELCLLPMALLPGLGGEGVVEVNEEAVGQQVQGQYGGVFVGMRAAEHPPLCSCFYQEFAGRQEKLQRYF